MMREEEIFSQVKIKENDTVGEGKIGAVLKVLLSGETGR